MAFEKDYRDSLSFFPESEKPIGSFRKILTLLLICVFCLIIGGVGLIHYILPDKSFSESENRVLAQLPSFSIETLSDGSFMKDFEAYLNDQFPFRDTLISAKTFCDRIIGKNEENGVYIGKEGFLFEEQTTYTRKKAKELMSAIGEYCRENKRIKNAVIIAPNSSYVYSSYLPDELEMFSQKKMLEFLDNRAGEGVNVLDIHTPLKKAAKKDTLLYYKTDHHWTTDGAYVAFKSLAEHWKLDAKKVKYDFYTVSDSFEGTLSSKAGVRSHKDEIRIAVPQKSVGTYVVSYESRQKKTASLFEKDKLKQKNQYELFMGGNFDKVIISTVADTEDTLLLVKDSYANCMIPMLTPYFSKIVVIDPRYLTDSFSGITKEFSFTHVLFLYNMNTFLGDTSLAACLKS